MNGFRSKLCAWLLPGVVLALIVGGLIAISISVARGADRMPDDTEIQMAFLEGFRWGVISGLLSAAEDTLPDRSLKGICKRNKVMKATSGYYVPLNPLPKYRRAVEVIKEEEKRP